MASLSSAPTTKDAETYWSADADLRRHWRVWDDEVMVFHPKSGETHCLNPLAAHVLQLLTVRAMTTSELVDRLRAESMGQPTGQEIDSLLRQFDELGLISPST